jgi:hypothetical protein
MVVAVMKQWYSHLAHESVGSIAWKTAAQLHWMIRFSAKDGSRFLK